jgi:hypothetical protein
MMTSSDYFIRCTIRNSETERGPSKAKIKTIRRVSKQTLDHDCGLTWFAIPGASEPTLVANQQFVLYR